tara:strand:+ start:1472 stop:1945 length:474 start_codon:yes stop_codon:yes gene_type:complete
MSYLITQENIVNYVHNVDTGFSSEPVSTTIEYYPGTEVTYTPTTGASKVIYECNFSISWSPDASSSYSCSRLQYSTDGGSSWSTIQGTQMLEGNKSPSSDYHFHVFKHSYILDTWSGERKIRLAGRSYDSSVDFTVGGALGSNSVSCPHVSIYSVML